MAGWLNKKEYTVRLKVRINADRITSRTLMEVKIRQALDKLNDLLMLEIDSDLTPTPVTENPDGMVAAPVAEVK